MKLRNDVIKYQVRYHGSEYEDPYDTTIRGVCPECHSPDVRDSVESDDTMAKYVCDACGCKFDSHMASERTKAGEILSTIFTVLAIVFFILGFVCMIGAIILWGNESAPRFMQEWPDWIFAMMTFGGLIGGCILSKIFLVIEEHI